MWPRPRGTGLLSPRSLLEHAPLAVGSKFDAAQYPNIVDAAGEKWGLPEGVRVELAGHAKGSLPILQEVACRSEPLGEEVLNVKPWLRRETSYAYHVRRRARFRADHQPDRRRPRLRGSQEARDRDDDRHRRGRVGSRPQDRFARRSLRGAAEEQSAPHDVTLAGAAAHPGDPPCRSARPTDDLRRRDQRGGTPEARRRPPEEHAARRRGIHAARILVQVVPGAFDMPHADREPPSRGRPLPRSRWTT